MTDLSHTAQSVLDAYSTEADRLDREVSDREMLAAAIRAAADCLTDATSAHTLYAISDELEGVKYGTYRCPLPEYPSKTNHPKTNDT